MDVLTVIELGGSSVVLRRAAAADVPRIVSLLAADQLGATRDGVTAPGDLGSYQRAFHAPRTGSTSGSASSRPTRA
jgi:hypothetical protein